MRIVGEASGESIERPIFQDKDNNVLDSVFPGIFTSVIVWGAMVVILGERQAQCRQGNETGEREAEHVGAIDFSQSML